MMGAMASKSAPPSFDYGQTEPGLSVLRMAALLAEAEDGPDEETLDLLFEQVEAGHLVDADPAQMWPELVRGLMSPAPSKMIGTLRDCGALFEILPEVAALFGVPQISDGEDEVDLRRTSDDFARYGGQTRRAAGRAFRAAGDECRQVGFAARTSSRALPTCRARAPAHRRHLRALSPAGGMQGARAAGACRVRTRASRLENARRPRRLDARTLGAFDAPERFQELMMVCASDFCAHEGREGKPYPKAALLEIALKACADIAENDLEARQSARAEAIARAFRSERWASEVG